MRAWWIIGLGALLATGCAGPQKASGSGDKALSDEPAQTQGENEVKVRRTLAGPTSEEGFRDPVGFNGSNIFAPIDWPDADRERTGSGAPGSEYWQQQVDYKIDATLDADKRVISAKATVTYHNNSPDALHYVWLHLEQNLFRPESVGALSTQPESRFGFRGFEGGYDIKSVSSGGQPLELHQYDTMGRIDLPEAIQPGETYSFDIAWSFNIPPFGADRMAMEDVEQGTIFEIAQWFPAVAEYDDVDGWNTMAYLGQGEFYSDFGDYDVSITVPRSHIVVASGVLQNPGEVLTSQQGERLVNALHSDETVSIRSEDEVDDASSRPQGDGPLTWHFKSHMMRTFAWASSNAFIWDAAGLDVPGSAFAQDGRVLVQAVYPKEGLPVWSKAVQMARHSLGFNSEHWHPFPYPVATNVNGRVGGMEYPGFVFCSSRRSERSLYGVTDHEFGHTWFPMMINSDERRYPWMDEGFNTFLNMWTGADYNGRGPATRNMNRTAFMMTRGLHQPIMTYPDRMWPGQLGNIGYYKPATGLWMLREYVLGEERFDKAFKTYIDRWAFKHPQPSDFFRTMEDVAGEDLAWFWRGWFYTDATLDQAIAKVEQVPDVDEDEAGNQPWVYVDLVNKGEMVMPVRMKVTYDDGLTETRNLPVEIWSYTNAWTAGFDPGERTVTQIELDPDHMLPDTDRANGTWPYVEPEAEGQRGFGGRGGFRGGQGRGSGGQGGGEDND